MRTKKEYQKENIVLIVCDCLRADAAYNPKLMPFLNHLKAKNCYTDKAYTNSPQTYMAVPSMMTGYMPFEVTNQAGINKNNIKNFLPRLFKKIKFATIGITASIATSRAFGYNRYWDYFDDLWFARKYIEKNKIRGDKVLKSLKESKILCPYKNFIFLHFMEGHAPYLPIKKSKKFKIAKKLFHKLNHYPPGLVLDDMKTLKTLYFEECSRLDSNIEKTIKFLKTVLDWKKTRVIITADHGEAFYETNYRQHPGDHLDNVHHIQIPLITKGIKLTKKSYWTTDIYNLLVHHYFKKVKSYNYCIGMKKIVDTSADVIQKYKKSKIIKKYIPYIISNLKSIKVVSKISQLPYKCYYNSETLDKKR